MSNSNVTGFNIAALDRVVGNAPIVEVFRGLAGYYARLAEQVDALGSDLTTFGVRRDGLVRLTEEQAQAAAANGTVSRRLAELFPLEEVRIARDACRAVVCLLSEQSAYNEAECRRLIELLQASIAAGAARAAEVTA